MAALRQDQIHPSYPYLTPGTDYREFRLVPEVDRLSPWRIDLDDVQQARVERLLDDNIMFSLHDHPVVYPEAMDDVVAYNAQGRQTTGYLGLSRSRMDVVVDNLMDGMGCITPDDPWVWDDVLRDLGLRLADLAHQREVVMVRSLADIEAARAAGALGIVFGMEAATPIEENLDRIDILYGFGVRQLGIAYNVSNTLGCGLRDEIDTGLTPFGRRAVERMNRIGMAIDISHSGDRTSLETIDASEAPVLITHAGSRAVWDSARMKPDEVIRACAGRGGLIGIEAAPHTTISRDHLRHSIDSFMDHVKYCIDLVGAEHVAFGPDTLYGDHVGLHGVFGFGKTVHADQQFEHVDHVHGLENPTETFPNLVSWLVSDGFDDETIAALAGGNIMRVLKDVWIDGTAASADDESEGNS